MEEAIKIIKELLDTLPDSIHGGVKCWDWCWNELDDENQELVKTVRGKAQAFISERSDSCRDIQFTEESS